MLKRKGSQGASEAGNFLFLDPDVLPGPCSLRENFWSCTRKIRILPCVHVLFPSSFQKKNQPLQNSENTSLKAMLVCIVAVP